MNLNVGDKAPAFSARNQEGRQVSLADFKGGKLVLYFYPKDLTPGCTAQACSLRDNYKALIKAGYSILGVSTDSEKLHQKFIAKEHLPFDLISDPDRAVHDLYGAWGEKSMYGRKYMGTLRTTFVIDEKGKIEEIISRVDTRQHADQILNPSPATPGAKSEAPAKTRKALVKPKKKK